MEVRDAGVADVGAFGPFQFRPERIGLGAQGGGQRFGEMEVWALEGYGAAYTLREMLTIKSDDIQGRSEAFEAIIRGNRIMDPHTPASFKVLMNYLRGLSFDVKMNYENGGGEEFEIVKPKVILDLPDDELLLDEGAEGVEALSEVTEELA